MTPRPTARERAERIVKELVIQFPDDWFVPTPWEATFAVVTAEIEQAESEARQSGIREASEIAEEAGYYTVAADIRKLLAP